MQADTAEELGLLNEPLPGTSMFPPSQEQQDEPQIAWLANAAKDAGPFAARVFGFGNPHLGTAYKKLKQLQLEDELRQMREEGFPHPVEAAVDALDPNARAAAARGTLDDPGGTLGEVEILSRTSHPSSMGDVVQGGAPVRVFDDAEVNDDYLKSITTGDADMDRIIAERAAGDPNMVDGMIAGIRAVGKRGDDKIPDEGHVRTLLNSIGGVVERHIADKNPEQLKSMSLDAMRELGDLIGEDADRLKLNFMGGLQVDLNKPGQLAAQMIAGKNLLISELKVLDKLSDEAANAPLGAPRDAARIAWRRQAEMVAQLQMAFKGTQTDIARALAALRVPNTTDAQILSRDVNSILDDLGGVDKVDAAINAYRAAENPADRVELAKNLTRPATKWDAFYEVWINSILSGYYSHVKNTAGVLAAILSDNLETFGAATGQLVTRGMRGMERDVTFGDLRAKMFGQMMSLREATIASGKAAWYREEPAMLGAGSKIEQRAFHMRADAFSAAGMQYEGNWARSIDFMGSALTLGRAPLRALQTEDAFFKVVSYRGALYEEAYRTGRALGLEGDEFSTHIAKFIFAPPEEAIIKAQDTAKYVTLQSEMEGKWKEVQKALRGPARWIVPFYKTPTNAILYVSERSPFARRTKRYQAAIEAGGAEAAKAKTRMALGMATFAALGWEYSADNITGGISSDSRVRAAYLRQGIKPYSVRIGDEWVSYNVIEPVSTIIGIVADAMEIINHPDTDEREVHEIITGVAGAIGYNMTNKTFMAGIAKFLDAIRDPQRRLPSFVKQYVGSALPGSAAINEIRKLNDDLLRFKIDLLDPMLAKLPGGSEFLGIKRDLWGRPIAEHRFRSPYKPNERDKEIARLRLPINDHPKNWDKDIEYSIEERDFVHKRAGELSAKAIDSYMKTKEFKDFQKISIATGDPLARDQIKIAFRAEINKAREFAKEDLLNHPELGPGIKAKLQEQFEEREKKIQAYEKRKAMQ